MNFKEMTDPQRGGTGPRWNWDEDFIGLSSILNDFVQHLMNWTQKGNVLKSGPCGLLKGPWGKGKLRQAFAEVPLAVKNDLEVADPLTIDLCSTADWSF